MEWTLLSLFRMKPILKWHLDAVLKEGVHSIRAPEPVIQKCALINSDPNFYRERHELAKKQLNVESG